MTEAQTTTDKKPKRMRYVGRALAVVWVCCWAALVPVVVFLHLGSDEGGSVPDRIYGLVVLAWVPLAVVCVLAVPGWVAIAPARRRPAAGGAALVAPLIAMAAKLIADRIPMRRPRPQTVREEV